MSDELIYAMVDAAEASLADVQAGEYERVGEEVRVLGQVLSMVDGDAPVPHDKSRGLQILKRLTRPVLVDVAVAIVRAVDETHAGDAPVVVTKSWLSTLPLDKERLVRKSGLTPEILGTAARAMFSSLLRLVEEGDRTLQIDDRTIRLISDERSRQELVRQEALGNKERVARLALLRATYVTRHEQFALYKQAAELLLYDLNRAAEALEPAQKALELRPDEFRAYIVTVDAFLETQRFADAERMLAQGAELRKQRSGELAIVQQRRARLLAASGDSSGQLELLKEAFQLDRRNAEVAAELAQLATNLGDYELALKPLRAIAELDHPAGMSKPKILLWEAKLENALGDRERAARSARDALQLDPNLREAKELLGELQKN